MLCCVTCSSGCDCSSVKSWRWERPSDTTFTHTLITHTAAISYIRHLSWCTSIVMQISQHYSWNYFLILFVLHLCNDFFFFPSVRLLSVFLLFLWCYIIGWEKTFKLKLTPLWWDLPISTLYLTRCLWWKQICQEWWKTKKSIILRLTWKLQKYTLQQCTRKKMLS